MININKKVYFFIGNVYVMWQIRLFSLSLFIYLYKVVESERQNLKFRKHIWNRVKNFKLRGKARIEELQETFEWKSPQGF